MRFETLEIDPKKNPAVLDTATWEPTSAWYNISGMDESFFMSVSKAIKVGRSLPLDRRCIVYAGSCAEYREKTYCLAELLDGQHVFIEIGPGNVLSGLIRKINPDLQIINLGKTSDIELVKGWLIEHGFIK